MVTRGIALALGVALLLVCGPASAQVKIVPTPASARYLASGQTPTIASGFGTTPAIAGKDAAGRVTVGTGGVALTGVLTFSVAWTTAPACVANDEVTTLLVKATATTTTLTLTSATAWAAGDTLTWVCIGY
ncbi:MAG TPA: hypothetical protein VNJ04_13835 [Gemmatimonadaceae bacterium]|nr:hypothetical protein [Gemmatimonadaceae bacterium]